MSSSGLVIRTEPISNHQQALAPVEQQLRGLKASQVAKMAALWTPKTILGAKVWESLKYLPPELAAEIIDQMKSLVVAESNLSVRVFRGLGFYQQGLIPWAEVGIEDWGIVSRKVVTDVGVGYIVDAFQNIVELENMKYHGLGTGTTAEAAADTALVTELTTEYNPNSTRATGTTTEGAANVYVTVATNTLDSGTPAITEHGVFSANAAGVLLDRSKFSAINLVGANGDALQTTYSLTLTSGG